MFLVVSNLSPSGRLKDRCRNGNATGRVVVELEYESAWHVDTVCFNDTRGQSVTTMSRPDATWRDSAEPDAPVLSSCPYTQFILLATCGLVHTMENIV